MEWSSEVANGWREKLVDPDKTAELNFNPDLSGGKCRMGSCHCHRMILFFLLLLNDLAALIINIEGYHLWHRHRMIPLFSPSKNITFRTVME